MVPYELLELLFRSRLHWLVTGSLTGTSWSIRYFHVPISQGGIECSVCLSRFLNVTHGPSSVLTVTSG